LEVCNSLELLLDAGQPLGVQESVRSGFRLLRSRSDALRLAGLCQRIPITPSDDLEWIYFLARVAYRAGMTDWCAALTNTRPGKLLALDAWVLAENGGHSQALELANLVIENPGSIDTDVAWRVRARAKAQLGDPNWRAAFNESLEQLEGRMRGLCLLEFGFFLTGINDQAASRSAYAEASGLLSDDPIFAALTQFNIGMACVHLSDLEAAKKAFETTMRLTLLEPDQQFLSGAWCGLGAVRRARREYPRAIHAYSMALQKAVDPLDRIEAGRGMALTKRLTGDVDGALQALFEALGFVDGESHGMLADLAAAKMQNTDLAGALQAIVNVPEGFEEDTQRKLIVRAEAFRHSGDLEAARKTLSGIDASRQWFADEAICFPELFALRDVHARVEPMQIRLNVDGPIRAWINDDPLELNATALAASLLALLIHEPGGVSFERCVTEFLTVPGSTDTAKQKSLERAIEGLRRDLGWPASIRRSNGVLRLDQDRLVTWLPLEVPDAKRSESFCAGRFDPWVLEWRDEHRNW
jgi:tetratricopeptide (TPR) repeat protein